MSEVVLRHDGGEHTMSVTPATEGAPGIDLGKLLASTGLVTLDPGFVNTAACASEITSIRLLAKLPTIAAYAFKKSVGQPFLYPDNSLGLVENFLRMTFGLPAEPYEPDPELARALDLLFILHADHEQNCSTSTVRLVGSSEANLFASISAGINALFGPLHGGANSAVLDMLEGIKNDGGDVGPFVNPVKSKGKGVRLMGFWH